MQVLQNPSFSQEHYDYKDEDYEVEFNLDLEPQLRDLLPHLTMPAFLKRSPTASGKYEDEDYEVQFNVDLNPHIIDLFPPKTERVRDNLTIQLASLVIIGAVATAHKLCKKTWGSRGL